MARKVAPTARMALVAAMIAAATLVVGAGAAAPARAGGDRPPKLSALHPGNPTLRVTPVHVNIVTVGYAPGTVDTGRLLSLLPREGVPIPRGPANHGIYYATGNDVQYRYTLQAASPRTADAFFGHLARTGTVGPPDTFQARYNNQPSRSVAVGPRVRYIDARDTERWLENHVAPALGIDPADDTVFLVDWYGRRDFQFHTYTHQGPVDPDSGRDLSGLDRSHVRAWGGSSGPTWFFDLSAGPVATDGSFDVDDLDLNQNGTTDDRMPPIWDYGHAGYRPFDDLTGDLAKIVRYVAIDDIFVAAPLYDPIATEPLPGGHKQVELDVFEGDPGTSGLSHLHADQVLNQLQQVQPYLPIGMSVSDVPLTGGALTAYQIGSGLSSDPGCWSPTGVQWIEFPCYFLGNFPTYFAIPDIASVAIPEVGFTVDDQPSLRDGFQGYAQDDENGTPALVTMFDDSWWRQFETAAGYTELSTHETGHFLGLAHPHDGEDPEQHLLFGPDGDFGFLWAGDESASVMSYLPGNLSFDVFDRDNLARNLYGGLSIAADYYAGVLLAQPPNSAVNALLAQADARFHAADVAVRDERWIDAGTDANTGFLQIARALQIDGFLPSAATTASGVRARAAGRPAGPYADALSAGLGTARFRIMPHEKACSTDRHCPQISR